MILLKETELLIQMKTKLTDLEKAVKKFKKLHKHYHDDTALEQIAELSGKISRSGASSNLKEFDNQVEVLEKLIKENQEVLSKLNNVITNAQNCAQDFQDSLQKHLRNHEHPSDYEKKVMEAEWKAMGLYGSQFLTQLANNVINDNDRRNLDDKQESLFKSRICFDEAIRFFSDEKRDVMIKKVRTEIKSNMKNHDSLTKAKKGSEKLTKDPEKEKTSSPGIRK